MIEINKIIKMELFSVAADALHCINLRFVISG